MNREQLISDVWQISAGMVESMQAHADAMRQISESDEPEEHPCYEQVNNASEELTADVCDRLMELIERARQEERALILRTSSN